MHDQVAAPAAGADVVRSLSAKQMPVSQDVLHGGRYRNAVAALSATTPLAVNTGSGAGASPAGRKRSERGRAAALTPARSDRHSPARVVRVVSGFPVVCEWLADYLFKLLREWDGEFPFSSRDCRYVLT